MGALRIVGGIRRARLAGVVLLAACGGGAIVDAATASADLSSRQIIASLNRQRTANAIPPVRNDAAMAAGCADYNRYVVRNGLSVADTHYENPHLPGYTAAGDHAARTSVLASDVGDTYSAFGHTVGPTFSFGWSEGDPWNNAAFHLFQMMNPALAVSGANELTAKLHTGEWVRLECLNTIAGPLRAPPRKPRVYVYPRSGSTVPVREQNQESEPVLGVPAGASGPPLTFAYLVGRGVTHAQVSVHMTINGKAVPVRTGYAGGATGPGGASAAALRGPFAQGPLAEAAVSSRWFVRDPSTAYRPGPGDPGDLSPGAQEVTKMLWRFPGFGRGEMGVLIHQVLSGS
ncbi:MAG: hypothetical protein ACRDL5_06635 [Solirubrobacteraceae bacterium]